MAIPADIPKAISDDPAPLPCRCCGGVPKFIRNASGLVTWIYCPACLRTEAAWLEWDAWAGYGPIPGPAPIPFPAPPEIPVDLSAIAAGAFEATTDLDLSLTATRAAAFSANYGPARPKAEALRAIADKLAELSEAAGQASRDIHDAIPDVVA